MGLGGYRNLRDANVWHRGINQLRKSNRSSGNAAALKLAALKSRRQRASDSQAEPAAAKAEPPRRLGTAANRGQLNMARRNLRLWRRGREFIRAALGLGRAVRQSVLARAAGGGRQAMQVNMRNRARGLRAGSHGEGPPSQGAWTQLSRQIKADGSLHGNTKSFRTRKLRRLGLRLLERAFRRPKRSNNPQEIHRRNLNR